LFQASGGASRSCSRTWHEALSHAQGTKLACKEKETALAKPKKGAAPRGRRFEEVIGEFLQAPAERAAYVEAVLAQGDAATLRAALRDVARAQGMAAPQDADSPYALRHIGRPPA
jgi:hypothetical protein